MHAGNMSRTLSRLIFSTAEQILEKFIESMKKYKNIVRVKFYGKRHYYGIKLHLVVRHAETKSTIINILLKVRSVGQLNILRSTLKGVKSSVHHYVHDLSEDRSDSDVFL